MAFNLGSSNNSGKLHISDFLNSGTQVQNAKLTFVCLVLNDGVPLPDIEEFNNGLEELIQHGYIDDN